MNPLSAAFSSRASALHAVAQKQPLLRAASVGWVALRTMAKQQLPAAAHASLPDPAALLLGRRTDPTCGARPAAALLRAAAPPAAQQ